MSEDNASSSRLTIILTVAAVMLLVLLVELVRWGNSIGYHPPAGHSRYNPGVGYFTDPPKAADRPPSLTSR